VEEHGHELGHDQPNGFEIDYLGQEVTQMSIIITIIIFGLQQKYSHFRLQLDDFINKRQL
jgi:hypothetical protein